MTRKLVLLLGMLVVVAAAPASGTAVPPGTRSGGPSSSPPGLSAPAETTARPSLDVDIGRLVAGETHTGSIVIANGLDHELRNVVVELDASGLSVEDDRLLLATVRPGTVARVPFNATATGAGSGTLTATVRYTADGSRRTVEYSVTVRIAPRRADLRVVVNRTVSGGQSIPVRLVNTGTVPLRRIVVSGHSSNASVGTATVGRLAPGSRDVVRLDVNLTEPRATVRVSARYGTADGGETVTEATTVTGNPGRIRLTGLNVEWTNGKLHVTGSAGNVGASPVRSVIVGLVATDGVAPAYPQRTFFVGTIRASNFAAFDLYADVADHADSVAVRLIYTVAGKRQRRIVAVDVPPGATRATTGGGGGGRLVPALLVALLVLVLGAIGIGLKNRNAGD